MFICIGNDGQAIRQTNYWDLDMASRGLYYLSWNAGAARLLVPDGLEGEVRDMRTAAHVIVSRGWYEYAACEMLELLFDDRSDSPFCVVMDCEQTDRLLPPSDCGKQFPFTVWTRSGKRLQRPGYYRMVPCLEPWTHQGSR